MFDEHGRFIKPDRGSAPAPDHIMLSIADDPHTTATFTWRCSTDTEIGYMLFYEDSTDTVTRVDALYKTLQSDIDISNFFGVTTRSLKPGTKYRYTVGSDEHRSAEFTFETEPLNLTKFKFLIISDHQKGAPLERPDYTVINDLLRLALKKHPDCRFILTAGDNCDNGQNELQWNGMFSGLAGIIESIPFMMSTGNHDNRGFIRYLPQPVGKFYLQHADYFDAQFEHAYPKNGPEGFETENYSFDYGNAHFLVMGINAPEKVAPWAYDDLRHSDKPWKIATYHFPIYPVMPEGQNDDAYPWLRKPIESGRADIVFAGHEHSFARTFPIKDDQMFDRPSQGTVHYIMGNSGRNIFTSNAQKVWHSCFYPQEELVAMVSVAEIDGDVMTITAYLDDGRIADRFVLNKGEDTIEPSALAPIYKHTKMAFKGALLELIARDLVPVTKNGIWFAPFAAVVQAVGGAVEKRPGEVHLQLYSRNAVFYENSDVAVTEKGTVSLSGTVFRERGQLYMPVDDCANIFGLKWQYAHRNNIINFDSPSENRTISEQP